MPRLEGVKVLDMKDGEVTKIEYEGEVYTKVDGGADDFKVGDIALNKIDAPDANAGNYYKVIYLGFIGSEILLVLDDANEVHSDILYQSDIFRKAEQTERKPKPGDFAKVIGGTFWGNIEKGTIVKITDEADYHDDIRFETLNGDNYDYAKAESLEKVNPTERELSFLRAGRNVGEFKEGDIVYVISDEYEDIVGKLVEVLSEPYGFSTGGNVEVEFNKSEHIVLGNNLKLVAPVESRVDLIGEKSYA